MGITSACAEQTRPRSNSLRTRKDHLRVCGADDAQEAKAKTEEGSPPRVRSRPMVAARDRRRQGITSACAEQTYSTRIRNRETGDHLRVCGADQRVRVKRHGERGSPPRVRSRLSLRSIQATSLRITSACAEQTWRDRTMTRRHRDHLRVCGADKTLDDLLGLGRGSPPRVRSRLERIGEA